MALTKVTGQVINNTTGLVVGVTTVGGGISATDGFFSGIVTAVGDASFSGNVSVGGTLTYEDVTNIDAVGLVTARNGIVVGSGITLSKDGDIFATGITTISENLKVGTGVTLSPDGDGFYTGVVTATSFSGDGSNLTGLSGVSVANQSDNRLITCTGTTDALNGEANLSYTSSSSLNLTDGNGTSNLGGNYLLLKRSTGNTNYINAPLADADLLLSADENIYFNTVHTADFNSTERFRIASAGQLGIGGANYGTSGQVLTSQGSSSAPQWATPASATSGTYTSVGTGYYVDITTTSTNIVKYDIMFTGVSIGGGMDWQFQLGDSGGVEGSGYEVVASYRSHNSSNNTNNRSDAFRWHGTGNSGFIMDGKFSLTRIHNNKWFGEGQLVRTEAGSTLYDMWGTKELSGALTTIRISSSYDDSEVFDGGHFKVIEYTGTV